MGEDGDAGFKWVEVVTLHCFDSPHHYHGKGPSLKDQIKSFLSHDSGLNVHLSGLQDPLSMSPKNAWFAFPIFVGLRRSLLSYTTAANMVTEPRDMTTKLG